VAGPLELLGRQVIAELRVGVEQANEIVGCHCPPQGSRQGSALIP
jgi:hypothetical protein